MHSFVDARHCDLPNEVADGVPCAYRTPRGRAGRAQLRRQAGANLGLQHGAERCRHDAVRARILRMHGRDYEGRPLFFGTSCH